MPVKLKTVKIEINAVVFKLTFDFEVTENKKRQTRPRKTKKKNKES